MANIHPSRRRKLRTWSHGKSLYGLRGTSSDGQSIELIDLASNDYLGLSRHPNLLEAAEIAIKSDGVGAGGSRFITGSRPIHKELEEALSDWLGYEKVFLFPSGFQANIAAVIALANRNTVVIADKLVHHSLLTAVKTSGAKLYRFKHNDLDHLERRLNLVTKSNSTEKSLVITEGLFSMEGTSPPLEKIAQLCDKKGANLLVDEAHSLGILGNKGKGLCNELSKQATLISGTFGKAFGSGGAFLACNAKLGDYIVQTSGAFRYTTALAPALAASALAALKLIQNNPSWGAELQETSKIWRNNIEKIGWEKPPGFGPILSLEVGSDKRALDLQYRLEEVGLLSIAIRPPTVPEGTSRLRLALKKNLPNETLKNLLKTLAIT